MVLLRPLLEGEIPKTCHCGATGICSPIRERSTFYIRRTAKYGRYRAECRVCTSRAASERDARLRAEDPEGYRSRQVRRSAEWAARNLEKKRARDREYARRRRREDPGAAAEAQRRYQRKLREDPERYRRALEGRRLNHRLRKERREEGELAIAEPDKTQLAGISLAIGPYRGWLEERIEEEERAGEENAFARVASAIGVTARTLYRYLHDFDSVDEAIVDRAVSRDGRLTLYDLYPEQLEYEPPQMRLTEAVG